MDGRGGRTPLTPSTSLPPYNLLWRPFDPTPSLPLLPHPPTSELTIRRVVVGVLLMVLLLPGFDIQYGLWGR